MPDRSVSLVPHPAHPCDVVQSIHVSVARAGSGLRFVYDVRGRLDDLRLSIGEPGIRRDELWQRTCFECFVRDGSPEGYVELNFSPGGDWAAYRFGQYRNGGRDLVLALPQIDMMRDDDLVRVSVSLNELPPEIASEPLHLSPCVIIETKHGARSFWALDHIGETPDFHRSETFTLSLD